MQNLSKEKKKAQRYKKSQDEYGDDETISVEFVPKLDKGVSIQPLLS